MKDEHIKLIKHQIEDINNLMNLNHEDPKFKKWHEMTKMILEESLGSQNPKLREFNSIYFFELVARPFGGPKITRGDIEAYQRGLADARLMLEILLKKYEIFEPDKGLIKMDDDKIRSTILEEAYSKYRVCGFDEYVDRSNFIQKLGVPRVDFDRNEEYLKRKGFIAYPCYGKFVITEIGVDLMEKPEQFQTEKAVDIQISDVNAPVSIVVGNLSTSIAKVENRGIEDLPDIIRNLTNLIQSSNLTDDDKIEVIENLETVTNQVDKTKPNMKVIQIALDTISGIAGKINGVIQLLKSISDWFGL